MTKVHGALIKPELIRNARKHIQEALIKMMTVNTTDFVSALKRLKIHLKARRNLSVLVRDGDSVGERILELTGRSKISGILTTVHGDGDWYIEVLVPAASLCGLMLHPPADQVSRIAYSNGRFHVGAWNCPAKLNME